VVQIRAGWRGRRGVSCIGPRPAWHAVVSVRRGPARRGGAGGWASAGGVCWRGRGGVYWRSAPGLRGVVVPFLGACLSRASAAGRNGRASLVVSELGHPLDNQAAAACAWGWFLLHPYSAEIAPDSRQILGGGGRRPPPRAAISRMTPGSRPSRPRSRDHRTRRPCTVCLR
jgi:hypothetical protein